MMMTQTMRWFGPRDPVPLQAIRQAGATGIVTALHEVANGDVWTTDAIAARRILIEEAGLEWKVVESLPVAEDLKRRTGDWDRLIAAYIASLRNLAGQGVEVVTYNFMPLLDWTRTDLSWVLPDGARALRFELQALATYDIHILRRPNAERDYAPELVASAAERFATMDAAARDTLERTIIAGLPGSEESFSSAQLLEQIETYAEVDAAALRANHIAFLEAVCPVAEAEGIRLVVHPDDPPFPIFGLPRVVSTEADVRALVTAVPSVANGLCFCSGSFGARADNDLSGIVRRLGDRIGFVHLRSVQREPGGAFHEAAHLAGDANMPAIMTELAALQARTGRSLPMRPDHGHQMADDLNKRTNPGYSLIGRLRGLAELRGLELGLAYGKAPV
ncbi:D-mannonate dehydratase [Sphingomonas sp. PP-F2F-G114-C0414]|uniref:mannonate dehydratase n=1 Tax=Sphingomonas sp. PP-F2F-G114-C0414 TaxID=2135662 RepID=UPI000EF86AF0|nr:mannonate dehydratase [Sphingomonas sp. PP-F2F-G114-C0414]RMB28266.1 D-mannonate dehydratase [Sphingomonas sp. PP-F2F-G114-C0414]